MITKIEYDEAISTISTFLMVEICPNLLKSEEIIKTILTIISSTQPTICEWTGMLMRPGIYSLLNLTHGKTLQILGQYPPNVGNPMATKAECKHHHNLWKF